MVFRAVQEPLGRPVAIKLQSSEVAQGSEMRERFRREWTLAVTLDHPNVLPIYDAGEEDGVQFITMRLVEGGDLGRLIAREGPLAPLRAARLTAQVAQALDAAHQCGLVHRDVKPANVLVEGDEGEEHAYLTDFGAGRSGASSQRLTRQGQWLGTLGYVAPEVLQGEPVDGRADVYSLGCVLFEALTGRPPFERGNDGAIVWAHLNEPPPRVSSIEPAVGAGLDAVVAKALQRAPGKRQHSAGELGREALAAARDATHTNASTARASRPPNARRHHSRIIVLAAAGALAACAAVYATVGLIRDGEPSPTGPPAPREAGTVIGTPIRVGRGPLNLAVSAGAVWVTNFNDDSVSRIDPAASAETGARARVGDGPYGITAGEEGLWVTDGQSVRRLNPRTRRTIGKALRMDGLPTGIAIGAGAVWVALLEAKVVTRIDLRTGARTRIPVGANPAHVAFGFGAVWVTTSKGLARINPRTNRLAGPLIAIRGGPIDVAVGAGAVWLTARDDNAVVRVDPRTNRVIGRPIKVGPNPYDVTVGAGSVWVTSHEDDTVTRLDARTGEMVGRPLPVGDGPRDVAIGLGAVWVANTKENSVSRIEPAP